ncbi:hypothetical protein [Gordonia sp. FQ]|uniref:hypothetical protein n=1 Tax=Gordonia sp. FQ TaxID=3446634 RepID=UPI003F84DEE4
MIEALAGPVEPVGRAQKLVPCVTVDAGEVSLADAWRQRTGDRGSMSLDYQL